MTCKELIINEHPEFYDAMHDIPSGCPNDYGYLPTTPADCPWPYRHMHLCQACWNREIPENNDKENEEMKENTCPNYAPCEAAPRSKTAREIEEEMLRLRAEHYERMTTLANELEEAKKREALEAAAMELKEIVDAYVKAGFTRKEALTIVRTNIKALSIN